MNLQQNIIEFLNERANRIGNGEAASFASEIEEELEDFAARKETPVVSPVEQMFYIEWQSVRRGAYLFSADERFELLPQYQLDHQTGKYRLDFSVSFLTGIFDVPSDSIYRDPLWIAENVKEPLLGIEIDGHQWHERTKDQAQRDKSRERFLVSKGWQILRFTGSEVFRDPNKCVHETIDCAHGLAKEWHGRIRKFLGVK